MAVVKPLCPPELDIHQVAHGAAQQFLLIAGEGMGHGAAAYLVPQDVLGFLAQVLLDVGHVVFAHSVDLGHRQPLLAEVACHIDERIVLLARLADDAHDGALAGQAVVLAVAARLVHQGDFAGGAAHKLLI